MAAPERRFRYALDPVCLIAVGLYCVNRLLIKPSTGNPADFWHCYANDVLCLPFWLPPMLWLQRRLHLRHHDLHPSLAEIGMYWLLWSWCFEVLGPELVRNAVPDHLDVIAYGTGGTVAACLWRSPIRPRASRRSWSLQIGALLMIVACGAWVVVVLATHDGYGAQDERLRSVHGALQACSIAFLFTGIWLLERFQTRRPFRGSFAVDLVLSLWMLAVAAGAALLILTVHVPYQPGVH